MDLRADRIGGAQRWRMGSSTTALAEDFRLTRLPVESSSVNSAKVTGSNSDWLVPPATQAALAAQPPPWSDRSA